jgi:hypothetical protein
MDRVEMKPALLQCARERAGLSADVLGRRFPKIDGWERGELQRTLKKLERFAKATYTQIASLFLDESAADRVSIRDFCTV